MEPEINKLISFYHFFDRAKDKFVKEIRDLCHPQRVNKVYREGDGERGCGSRIELFVMGQTVKVTKWLRRFQFEEFHTNSLQTSSDQ